MPSAYVSQLAKEKGISVAKAEERWSMAKDAAEKQGRGEDFAYVTGIFKKMMGESEVDGLIDRILSGEKSDKVWENVLSEGSISWHVPSDVQEMLQKAYTHLHKMKHELDQMEEIPDYLRPLYDKLMSLANGIANLSQESENLKMLVRKQAMHGMAMPYRR